MPALMPTARAPCGVCSTTSTCEAPRSSTVTSRTVDCSEALTISHERRSLGRPERDPGGWRSIAACRMTAQVDKLQVRCRSPQNRLTTSRVCFSRTPTGRVRGARVRRSSIRSPSAKCSPPTVSLRRWSLRVFRVAIARRARQQRASLAYASGPPIRNQALAPTSPKRYADHRVRGLAGGAELAASSRVIRATRLASAHRPRLLSPTTERQRRGERARALPRPRSRPGT